jgi:hypothetical protein
MVCWIDEWMDNLMDGQRDGLMDTAVKMLIIFISWYITRFKTVANSSWARSNKIKSEVKESILSHLK